MHEIIDEKKIFTLAGVFIALCFAVGIIIWWYVHELNNLREEYDMTEYEREGLVTEIEALTATKNNLEKLNGLNLDTIKPATDIIDFYSHVRHAAENNDVNILTTRQSNKNIDLVLRGGYYSFINLLGEWRAMPTVCKISQLKLQKDKDAPALFIIASVTLTAY
ncbi:MAG: hypothetical protein IJS99_03245 [Synergistaceae bacterium]|nr:hypothetical protein [Synergistaceae bacterium]